MDTNINSAGMEIDEELAADGSRSGVEKDDDFELSEPFNPMTISIEPKVVPMETVIRRLLAGSIRLAPDFQRSFVWDITKSSQLIESLMLRIPLPMFYVSANAEGEWDVVDGLQRLTTIRNFILGGNPKVPNAVSFKLKNLEFWGERFDNKSFEQIQAEPGNARIINNILETEMRFTVINPGTPEEVKRNIFKRINTGGMPLTIQEIRHALYQGHSTSLLQSLVNLPEFKKSVNNSVDDSRMAGRELILRFLAFYHRHHSKYPGNMDKFLSDTMRFINRDKNILCDPTFELASRISDEDLTINKLTDKFKLAMRRCYEFFGPYAFRKSIPNQRRTPINKALFEVWANIFSVMPEENYQRLLKHQNIFWPEYAKLLEKTEFERAISRDASSILGVRERYESLQILLLKTLQG